MTWPGLPILVRVAGQPVILLGESEAADAKRRVLERAGALVVDDHPDARLAVVAIEDEHDNLAAVAALTARGLLVNAVDRPALCDFTLPAVVDRAPVLVAVATGGASAGLAAALRQRLEVLLPPSLGRLAEALFAARARLRTTFPDAGERRRAIGDAFHHELDPLDDASAGRVPNWLGDLDGRLIPSDLPASGIRTIALRSSEVDALTLGEARWLALADRVFHRPDIPVAILQRARADAPRMACEGPPGDTGAGLSVWIGWA